MKYTDESKNEEDAEKKVYSFPVVTPEGMEDTYTPQGRVR